ncbi:hypothetical protein B296_00028894 [Ensete ventricosum]|uniref:Uncharacterized protein n=1 Tax=Ensete ventricosum TaxID=4639 RepID=A0A426ZST5_ENSVE|nr:hypothetical protein B296_00028894 [Ensete ventricosum]
MVRLARGDRSKCDSGSGNRRPLGCGRGGRRRGAVVAAELVEEGEIWSNPLTLIAEGWPVVGEQKFDGSGRERRLEQSRRSDPVMGASGCSALLLWLKGTPGCEGALRVAIGEEVLGSAEAE